MINGSLWRTRASASAIAQVTDGQDQAQMGAAPVSAASTAPATHTMLPVSQIDDGQIQAPASPTNRPRAPAVTATTTVYQKRGLKASSNPIHVACALNDTLTLTLTNGVLKDRFGRTGYIASNFRFQFDDPPQASAIYTAGFSVCANESLALGGSATWWRCRSGEFYNLYDRWWAEQCEEVGIQVVGLRDCA
ncbi:hypothetical protein W97_00532 [Coniosporium apollinis CBS 100218]|uniref:Cell wall mannoprotein PIR1-like C-terminal domain-containing protein n=1 Tax=Coniosporium apollinis (strain CBS 100218) TaxID=1168221 RepID=R7YHN4_CONA1|nr:uncharacterized protein W97_00532 [Coniosporium apollinis CBS 100218]EON61319.1 hypothetical protein W97_00532 [Coniosporium apollinis CBS 100218]